MRIVLVVFLAGFLFTAFVITPGSNYSMAALGGLIAVVLAFAFRTVLSVVELRLHASDQRRRDTLYLRLGMRSVDVMSGREFEKYVAARVRQMGWDVSATPATGDFGVDLIAERGSECVAIQCKRHAKPVGVSAVQQVVAGARLYMSQQGDTLLRAQKRLDVALQQDMRVVVDQAGQGR